MSAERYYPDGDVEFALLLATNTLTLVPCWAFPRSVNEACTFNTCPAWFPRRLFVGHVRSRHRSRASRIAGFAGGVEPRPFRVRVGLVRRPRNGNAVRDESRAFPRGPAHDARTRARGRQPVLPARSAHQGQLRAGDAI